MREPELVTISSILYTETEKAYGLWEGKIDRKGGKILIWVPKQFVEYDRDVKEFTMPEWLATEKGLI